MEHQDWQTFIVHANNDKTKAKPSKSVSKDVKLEQKIDDGDLKHKKIDPELSKKIQKARLSKKLTQKQLAQQLSIPQQSINEMETGKYLHNGSVISKVKRNLNIK